MLLEITNIEKTVAVSSATRGAISVISVDLEPGNYIFFSWVSMAGTYDKYIWVSDEIFDGTTVDGVPDYATGGENTGLQNSRVLKLEEASTVYMYYLKTISRAYNVDAYLCIAKIT